VHTTPKIYSSKIFLNTKNNISSDANKQLPVAKLLDWFCPSQVVLATEPFDDFSKMKEV